MAGRIPEFDAGNLSLRPSETGVEAEAGAARRVGTFYNQQAGAQEMLARETDRLAGITEQVGRETEQLGSEKGAAMASAGRAIGGGISDAGDAAVKYLDHQQISQGAASWSKLLQDTTTDWNNTVKNADPNNPHVAQDFMDSLEDRLSKFQENGFYTEGGQKWAEAHVDALRQHMTEKTMADMSSVAGDAVVVNHKQTVNSLSATVHDDPSSLDFALAGLKSSAEGMISSSPNLKGTDVARVRGEVQQSGAEAIVKSAAIGYIEKNGTIPPWATDPKYAPYINGADLKTLEKQAQVQKRVEQSANRQDMIQKKELADLAVHAGANKVMNDNVTIGPNGKPMIKPDFYRQALELARSNPDAPSAASTARTMLDWGESQQSKDVKIVDDPATVTELSNRLFDPNQPLTTLDLMHAQTQGKLSDHTFQQLERNVKELEETPLKGPIYQDTMKAVHSALVLTGVGIAGKDDVGEKKYASFVQSFIPQYLSKYRSGTLEPDALNMDNPDSMISKAMQPFKRSVTDRINDYVSTLGGPTVTTTGGVTSRLYGGVPAPVSLGGIAALQRNPTTGEWRDQSTGKLYNKDGSPK